MAASTSGSKINDHRVDGYRAGAQSADGDETGANQGDEDGAKGCAWEGTTKNNVDLDAIDVVVKDGLPTFQHPDGQLMFGSCVDPPTV